jgi:hypothetical protein
MRRRNFLAGTALAATGFGDPALYALTGVVERVAPGAGGRASAPTAGMIRDTAAEFRRLDASHGGGQMRSQVIGFLHDRARAALVGGRHTAELFSALAELTELGGWLAIDSRRPALAQRYYVQSLALAEHAEDHLLAGRVLAAMSDQAVHLGHPRQGLALARAALDRTRNRATPGVAAELRRTEAYALARAGDERGCAAALVAMEQAIGRVVPGGEPAWMAYICEADLAQLHGFCHLLFGRPTRSEACLLDALAGHDPARRRARACIEAELALGYAQRTSADLEAAVAAGHRALDLADRVNSGRVAERVRTLDRSLQPHGAVVAVRQWRRRAAPLLAAAA